MSDNNSQQDEKPIEIVRKFELAVYEEDLKDDGSVRWNQVSYKQPVIIEVKSQQELNSKLALYSNCGQRAKVVREIDPPTKEQIEAYINQQKKLHEKNAAGQTSAVNAESIISQPQTKQQVDVAPYSDSCIDVETQIQPTVKSPIQKSDENTKSMSKPKYYKVGDIEIKNDNGKIYQKQWMKLSDSEAANIRLVNDKTNALVNTNGKHYELKRWILVETQDDDDSNSIEECLK